MISAQIIDTFAIRDRGVVVAIGIVTEIPVGRAIQATIEPHDGGTKTYEAWKEWPLRRTLEPLETEAFLLVGATKAELPVGSLICLDIDEI